MRCCLEGAYSCFMCSSASLASSGPIVRRVMASDSELMFAVSSGLFAERKVSLVGEIRRAIAWAIDGSKRRVKCEQGTFLLKAKFGW